MLACQGGKDSAVEDNTPTCNGLAELCDRALDGVAFLRTHNSHASEERDYSTLSMNHYNAIPTQLTDGARALNVDVYRWASVDVPEDLYACHGYCELGYQPFVEILDEIETFLAANEREVLLLSFQDEVGGRALSTAISDHALSARLHTQTPGQPWPTLGEMIEAGQTLVVMGSPGEGEPAWMHRTSDLVYGTHWQYDTPEDLECVVSGTPIEHGLYEVTHVLTNPLASPKNAELINHDPVLSDHILGCVAAVGFVNLVSMDYYSIGDGLGLIDTLNTGAY